MNTTKECPLCKQTKDQTVEICDYCNYPFEYINDKKKTAQYIAQQSRKKSEVKEVYTGVKIGKNALYLIAAIDLCIVAFFVGILKSLPIVLYPSFIFGLIMFLSAIYMHKNPIIFLSIPLGLLSLLYTFYYLNFPDVIGFEKYFRIGQILCLSYALFTVIRSQKISKESPYLGSDKIWGYSNQKNPDILD